MKRSTLAVLVVAPAFLGCLSQDARTDPGPLEVAVIGFRTLEDHWNVEWIIEFRNMGDLPVVLIESPPGADIVDGSSFTITNGSYVASNGSYTVKLGGATPREPPTVFAPTNSLLPPRAAIMPGQAQTSAFRAYFDHINFSATSSRGGWQTFEEIGGVLNATDFYHIHIGTTYLFAGYEWITTHMLACFDIAGQRIKVAGPPFLCDYTSSIFNKDPPSWSRFEGP